MPARQYPGTARRWAAVIWVAVVAISGLALADTTATVWAYEAARPNATATADGWVLDARRPDVQVGWRDGGGGEHRAWFDVADADAYPVGARLPLRYDPARPDLAFPAAAGVSNPTDGPVAGVVFLVLALLLIQTPWLVRFWRWAGADRCRAGRYQARVFAGHSTGRWRLPGWSSIYTPAVSTWLRLDDGEGRYYQRVMWEPWLWRLPAKRRFQVTGRRLGADGSIVVDIAGYGRLWPAGRARRTEPWVAEALEPGPPSRRLRHRWLTLLVIIAVVGFVAALPWGWVAGTVIGSYTVSLWLFLGGPPLFRTR